MIFKKILAGVLSATMLVTATSMTAFAKETKKYDYVALGDSIAAGFGLNSTTRGSLEADPALILTEDLIADPVQDAYAQVFGNYIAELGQANGYITTATNLSSTAYRAVDVQNTILNENYKSGIAEWIFETFSGEGASAPLADYHDIYIKYLSEAELVSIQLGGNDIVMNIIPPVFQMENPVLTSVAISLTLTLFGCDTKTVLGGGLKVLMDNKDKISYKSVTEAAEYISSIKQNADSYVQIAADHVEDVVNAVKTVNETADIALIGMFDPYGNSLLYDGQIKDMSNIIRNIFVKSAEIVCGNTIKTDAAEILSDEEVEEKTSDLEKNVKTLSKFSARIKKFTGSYKTKFTKLVSAVANEIAYPIQYMTAGKNVEPQMLSLNEHLKEIAQKTGSIYVDIYNISNECNPDPHPDVNGHREIAEIMKTTLSDTVIKGMTGTEVPAPTSVKLNKTSVSVAKGQTCQLTATVDPTGASQAVTWTTSNKNIAAVDRNGVVTGVKSGNAVITATTPNGKKISCKVTVKKNSSNILQKLIRSVSKK